MNKEKLYWQLEVCRQKLTTFHSLYLWSKERNGIDEVTEVYDLLESIQNEIKEGTNEPNITPIRKN